MKTRRSAPSGARRTRRKRAVKSKAAEPAEIESHRGNKNIPIESPNLGGDGERAQESIDSPDSQRFIAEFTAHWRLHGKAAFDAVAAKDPARYLALAAKLIGRDGERAGGKNDLVALLAGLERD